MRDSSNSDKSHDNPMLGAMPEDRIDFYCDISQSEHISVTGYYRNFGNRAHAKEFGLTALLC